MRPGTDGYTTADIALFDMHGRAIMDYADFPFPAQFIFDDLPGGVYACVVRQDGEVVLNVKLMKM